MKIKLAILDSDSNYLSRLVTMFGTRYAEKLEIYSFTEKDFALAALKDSKIDMLLAGEVFEIDVNELPRRCAFAYFVESADIRSVRNIPAVCKFQKADLMYNQILNIYSEKASDLSGTRTGSENTRVTSFISPAGGVGCSSLAAACAVHFAAAGIRTLYLNLEKFGMPETYFTSEGNYTISDVIYSLKSKKANIGMKLESNVRRDAESGVYYFAGSSIALDIMELNTEDILQLLNELRNCGLFEQIILDIDFRLDADMRKILLAADQIVLVSNGTETANTKIFRVLKALEILENGEDVSLADRMKIIYNRFSNTTSKTLADIGIEEIGGAPAYNHILEKEVIRELAVRDIFDKLL